MIRPGVNQVFLTNDQWTALDPVVPLHVTAISIDTASQRFGDGVKKWSELPTTGDGTLAKIAVQSNRLPTDNEMLVMCAAQNKWVFRLIGCHLTQTECTGMALTIYPKHSIIIETNDSTNVGTGRIKIGDGVTNFSNLPWIGSFGTFESHIANLSNPHQVTKSQVGLDNVTNEAQVPLTQKGVANGVAPLDSMGKVPVTNLPSYVDDVLEYANYSLFPSPGNSGVIYIDASTNITYRWSGSAYIAIGFVDSPSDGKTYGRKNGSWTQVGSAGNIDCGNATSSYGPVSPIDCGGAS